MKIYLESYNTITQAEAGGIQNRLNQFHKYFNKIEGINAKKFDKWNDKLNDCDILYIFKALPETLAEAEYAKKLGKKVVVSSITPTEERLKISISIFLDKVLSLKAYKSLTWRQLALCDAVISESEKEKAFVSRYYKIPKEKIFVVPNGIEERFDFHYSSSNVRNIVLCVGRFDANKNQLNLIRAIKGTDIPIYLVGGALEKDKEYYKQCLKEADGHKNIHFTGWLKNDSKQLMELYLKSKVAVLVSHSETFGLALAEGAVSGCNLVASNRIPIIEWGLSNYVLVDSKDVYSIKSGILKAYDMPLDRNMSERARNYFSWERIIKEHIQIFENLF